MDLQELIIREIVRDLVARYNANGDTGRLDVMASLFAPKAVLEAGGEILDGQETIREYLGRAKGRFTGEPGFTHLRHSTTTLQIDVLSSTSARARCYFFVMMDHGLDHWGRYLDEFGVVDGTWYFTKRRVLIDKYTRPRE